MKKIATTLLFSFFAVIGFAQSISDRETLNSLPAETVNQVTLPGTSFNFSEDAGKIISDIMQLLGLRTNFTVKPGRVKNAAATIRHGKRYIEYNPEFINEMNRKKIPAWTYVFLLAQEIGHHLNGHTVLKGKKELSAELEADEFAGFILQKMGATLLQARTAAKHISNPVTTKTHPGVSERIDAVEKGWARAGQQ